MKSESFRDKMVRNETKSFCQIICSWIRFHEDLWQWSAEPYLCFCCRCDKDIKVSYTVYNRLSVLLKSLMAITRVTPAYKLSRKQGHDYVILYRWRLLPFILLQLGFRSCCRRISVFISSYERKLFLLFWKGLIVIGIISTPVLIESMFNYVQKQEIRFDDIFRFLLQI